MKRHHRLQANAGFTLVEMMIVLGLSAIVTLGIIAFYLSAQQTWTDASAQALAQRDGTGLLDAIVESARQAATAQVDYVGGDSTHCSLLLTNLDGTPKAKFFWSDVDTCVHYTDDPAGIADRGRVVPSRVVSFNCSSSDAQRGVVTVYLRVLSASSQSVSLRASSGMYNRQMR